MFFFIRGESTHKLARIFAELHASNKKKKSRDSFIAICAKRELFTIFISIWIYIIFHTLCWYDEMTSTTCRFNIVCSGNCTICGLHSIYSTRTSKLTHSLGTFFFISFLLDFLLVFFSDFFMSKIHCRFLPSHEQKELRSTSRGVEEIFLFLSSFFRFSFSRSTLL